MKRKIFSILFALVLVLSFSLVTAVPAVAQEETLEVLPFTLEDEAPATSQWVTSQQHTGSSSVELYDDGTSYANVWFDLPGDVTLAEIDLDSTSFWCKSTAGDNIPYLMFEIPGSFPVGEDTGDLLRINCDAAASAGYTGDWAEFVASSTTPEWQWEILIADTWTPLDTGWDTWATLEGLYGDLVIECIVVEISGLVGTNTAYVDDITVNGTTYYGLIQDAVDSASVDDTINVADGTYNENIVVNKSLTLQAASSPVIDGGGMLGPGVHITAEDVTFQGFTITDFTCTPVSGIGAMLVEGDGAVIDDNTIYDITTQLDPINNPAGIGIDVHASNVEVTNNIVHDVGSIGIRVRHDWDTAPTVSNNVLLEKNEVYRTANTGVLVTGYAKGVTIRENEIYESLEPTPYSLFVHYGAEDVLIENNIIRDSLYSNVVIAGADNVTISGNTITGAPEWTSPGKNIYILNDYASWTGDPTLLSTNINIINNDIQNGGYGVRIVYTEGGGEPSQMAATTTINFNDISGHTEYGVENTIATNVDALCNYWGHASGPTHSDNPGGTGDAVSDEVTYEPWLLEVGGSCYEQTQILYDGWTLVSTDKEVTTGTEWQGVTLAYKYTPSDGYVEVTAATIVADLYPANALYLKTDGGGGIAITYLTTSAPGVSSKYLEAGWNLISSATETSAKAVLSPLRYVQVGDEQGVGLATLVSQGKYNRNTDSFYLATFGLGDWFVLGATTLNPFDGYWVYMNAGKTFGVILD